MELTLSHLCRRYRDKTAVADFSATLTPGVWGLLGANGAGKTTLMKMIAGILEPSGGQILFNGKPAEKLGEAYRKVFGWLPQDFGFPPEFTVREYLIYVAVLKGLDREQTVARIRELLDEVSLTEVANRKIAKLSGGMRRRVGIAQALLNDPEILILDEPTAGLDPGERVRFRNLLSELAQDRIVLISTHIVSDVEYIATRHLLMKDGRLMASGTAQELTELVCGKVWTCRQKPEQVPALENRLQIIGLHNEEDGSVTVRYLASAPAVSGSCPAAARLEDVYLWLFPESAGCGKRRRFS
ncbi:ABC transporter ATP-binding protein [uncultured Faecalibaculum sp.]|uniref:ABC transporter ATP-binding protein n=1 Tax=uncultured Faecalibaculum sp. TaxID=1729681 RepID=UPI0025DC8C82|nr:ABC transporter ATP-binding protein [uncultured Faecalibaculum sp.]